MDAAFHQSQNQHILRDHIYCFSHFVIVKKSDNNTDWTILDELCFFVTSTHSHSFVLCMRISPDSSPFHTSKNHKIFKILTKICVMIHRLVFNETFDLEPSQKCARNVCCVYKHPKKGNKTSLAFSLSLFCFLISSARTCANQ